MKKLGPVISEPHRNVNDAASGGFLFVSVHRSTFFNNRVNILRKQNKVNILKHKEDSVASLSKFLQNDSKPVA
jgi:hypothetical protein